MIYRPLIAARAANFDPAQQKREQEAEERKEAAAGRVMGGNRSGGGSGSGQSPLAKSADNPGNLANSGEGIPTV